jgi:hypothetical protein
MRAVGRLSIAKVLAVLAVVTLGALALPVAAEAQSRGTLQATATIVDTRPSFTSLQAAQTALQAAVNPQAARRAVTTVAQVSVDRSSARPGTVVVTIDFSRN